MKIKLLNNGGYLGIKDCNFPIVIDGEFEIYDDGYCDVPYSLMKSIDGFSLRQKDASDGDSYLFNPGEFEVIS